LRKQQLDPAQKGEEQSPSSALLDNFEPIRILGIGAMLKLGRTEYQTSHWIRCAALDQTEAWRSNSHDRRGLGL
jgi:hypothetical protein